MEDNSEADADGVLVQLRDILRRCRSLTSRSISLSPALLERAQADFLQRRAAHRDLVGEDEFHRWLTLTRLQARSRMRSLASVEDWTAALVAHDAMQASLSPAIESKLRKV
jgi:Mini-chromosome maintenance replisome factor